MPLFYKHWTFGKHFARNEALYRKGWQGLAYEIVINSNPCIVYIMEENSATMQTLVLAHAAMGHNHFFKNNYVFKQWTDADGILDYLSFAKSFIAKCEERYGAEAVERLLDAAHALQSHGIHRYPGKRMTDLRSEERREQERRAHGERLFNDLWRTVPQGKGKKPCQEEDGGGPPQGAPRPAGREPALLPREDRAAAAGLAARNPAHRPPDRAVLLSAAPDQDDERRLRHLHAPSHHDAPAREGPDRRRRLPRIPALAHQRRDAAGLRRSPLSPASIPTRSASP